MLLGIFSCGGTFFQFQIAEKGRKTIKPYERLKTAISYILIIMYLKSQPSVMQNSHNQCCLTVEQSVSMQIEISYTLQHQVTSVILFFFF